MSDSVHPAAGHRYSGQFKSGLRWHQPRVRPAPEWGSPRTPGRIWPDTNGGVTCRTIQSPVERDTVSRALGALFGGMAKALRRAVDRRRPRRHGTHPAS